MGMGVLRRFGVRESGVAAMLALLAVAAVGCKQDNSVAGLPKPNFGGPQIVAIPTPPPTKAVPAPTVGGIPREWVPYAKARSWKWVIIHHSATPTGGARKFTIDHRERGFDDLGYDFVIGNGTETRDGQIEVGPRWSAQRVGAHTMDPSGRNRYNENGIGICLVGNFDNGRPTQAQLQSLARLVAYLQKTYRVRSTDVVGHRDCKATDCPGRNLSIAVVRRMAAQALAASGERLDTEVQMAGELLRPIAQ
jgi:hypothetical protein